MGLYFCRMNKICDLLSVDNIQLGVDASSKKEGL